MDNEELMTASDIHAFGVEIVCRQLIEDGWNIESADVYGDINTEPQIVANKDGERGFFVVRTDIHPRRGRFEEGEQAFLDLVQHAKDNGADCYYASVGIANSEGETDEEMSVPKKGVGYNVTFEGLIKMDLPPAA
jgi:hypothetical protein